MKPDSEWDEIGAFSGPAFAKVMVPLTSRGVTGVGSVGEPESQPEATTATAARTTALFTTALNIPVSNDLHAQSEQGDGLLPGATNLASPDGRDGVYEVPAVA